MDLFPRLRRARTDAGDAAMELASYWMRRYLDVLNLLADRRARMKDMAAEIRTQRLEIVTLREKLGAAEMLPLHESCGHSEAIHDGWGCTLCDCCFTPWMSVAGMRPSKVTLADDSLPTWEEWRGPKAYTNDPDDADSVTVALTTRAEPSSAELIAMTSTPLFDQGWSPEDEAASWLAEDDKARRRADR